MDRRTFVSSLAVAASTLPALVYAQGPGTGPGPGAGPGTGRGPGMGPGGPGPGDMGPMHPKRWTRERLYGAPLLTLEERQQHQQKMWNAKTVEERRQVRDEHRKMVEERAREQKVRVDEKLDDAFFIPALSPL